MPDDAMCVVLTGKPKTEQRNTTRAVENMAPNPWIGLILKSFMPIVLMIRLPPDSMPSDKANELARITHVGTTKSPPGPGV